MPTDEHAPAGAPTGEGPIQQAAQQNEERAALALKAGHVGVFDWDIAGGKVVWTLSQEEIFGLPSGTFDYPYEAWAQSVPEEDLARLTAFFLEWMDSEREDEQWEYRYRRGDGTMRWIAARGILLRDAQGRAVRMIGTNQDITERKQREEARERSLGQLQAVLDNMPEGVVVTDVEGNVLAMNAAALALHEYHSIEEARRWFPQYQETFELFDMSGKPLPLAQWPISRALRGEIFDEMEVNIRRKDLGQTRLFSFSGRPVSLAESGPMLGVLVVRDITEREQALQALRQSEERFRAIFEQAPLGIAVIDSWGGRFLQINPKYCEITGRSQEEMLTLDWMSITHPEDLQADRDRMARLRAGELPSYHMEKRYVHKNGSCVWVSLTVVPLWAGGEKLKCHIAIVEDITRRKEADAQLSAALRDLKNLKAAVDEHDIVAIADPQGTLTYVNDRFCTLSKYSREELLGQNPRVLNSGYHSKEFIRNLWKTIGHGRVWKGKFRNRAKDGSIFWLDTTIVPFLDASGKPYQYMAIRSDITELKRVEEALRESERQLLTLMNNLPGMAYRCRNDPDWTMEFVSNGAQALIGYSPSELIGNRVVSYASLIHPEDRQAVWEQVQAALNQRKTFVLNYRVRTATGEERWVWEQGQGVFDEQEQLLALEGFIVNITKLKRVEEALRESEKRFRTLANAIPQLAWIAQPDGYIVWYNQRWYDYTGTTPEQMEGWGWQSVHDKDELPKVLDLWKASIATGEPFDMTFPLRGADGIFRPFLSRGYPMKDAEGRIVQWFGTNTDISAQKVVEDALKESKEAAEAANHAKDQFIAVLSHELRTPLTPVLATVSALQTQEDVPAPLRADMELIRRNVEMEATLIDDLLDVTRISRGKIDIHQEVVDVHASLGMTVEICQEEIKAKRLEIRLEFHADQHHAWADPVRLRQVFWNLLKNAVKFTPEGGRVTLRTYNDGNRLKIEISDTGIGIEPDVLPRIFNLFEQGEPGKIRQFGGLGLGLHIARAVVELHQGRLTAFSEGKNKGATFTVELAAIGPPEKTETPSPTVEPQERPLRILLVEDHPDTLRVLVKLLKKWGHAVTTAETVRTAQELANGQEFDLLISDLGLPDGSGLDVMRQVKEHSGTPGIALSGFGTEEDIRQSRAAGFAEHLVKPVNIAALRMAIRQFAFAGS